MVLPVTFDHSVIIDQWILVSQRLLLLLGTDVIYSIFVSSVRGFFEGSRATFWD